MTEKQLFKRSINRNDVHYSLAQSVPIKTSGIELLPMLWLGVGVKIKVKKDHTTTSNRAMATNMSEVILK